MRVQTDGSLQVEENITYAFDGAFSGAFREVPLREGELLDEVKVSESGRQYRPGASAELGSAGAPDTFGTTRTDRGVRVVWHYSARDEQRTFRLEYRLHGLAVAYDDVVDVNLKVWGAHWDVGVGMLTATLTGWPQARSTGAGASSTAVSRPSRCFHSSPQTFRLTSTTSS